MIAVLIIGLIALIVVLVFIGFTLGFTCGILFATDEIMDDPYLRAAALRAMEENDSFYNVWKDNHDKVKDRINDKL